MQIPQAARPRPGTPDRSPRDVEIVKSRQYETAYEVEADIIRAKQALTELLAIEVDWGEAIQPARSELTRIRDDIRATHGIHADTPTGIGPVPVDLCDIAVAKRKALFARKDAVAAEWGPAFKELGTAHGAVKNCRKTISQLETLLDGFRKSSLRPKPPEAANSNQLDLFT